jgi:hypothetical protein
LELPAQRKASWFYDDTKGNIGALFPLPFPSHLALTGRLFMGEYGHTILCQISMNLLTGIVVGTINRLQFNKWEANGFYWGRL